MSGNNLGNPSIVLEAFSISEWLDILRKQPQFAEKCDKWDKFDGNDWSKLLQEQPQFAEKCDWSKLNDENWGDLLCIHPQFAENRLSAKRQKIVHRKKSCFEKSQVTIFFRCILRLFRRKSPFT